DAISPEERVVGSGAVHLYRSWTGPALKVENLAATLPKRSKVRVVGIQDWGNDTLTLRDGIAVGRASEIEALPVPRGVLEYEKPHVAEIWSRRISLKLPPCEFAASRKAR